MQMLWTDTFILKIKQQDNNGFLSKFSLSLFLIKEKTFHTHLQFVVIFDPLSKIITPLPGGGRERRRM